MEVDEAQVKMVKGMGRDISHDAGLTKTLREPLLRFRNSTMPL